MAFKTAESSEQKAFLQLASLGKNNVVDRDWIESVHRTNQRRYKMLMTIFLHAAGCSGLCSACEMRAPLKQRNCRALPPEARGMRELQRVIGQQCANCYFYSTSKPCEFVAANGRPPAPTQTPVPVPLRGQAAEPSGGRVPRPFISAPASHPASGALQPPPGPRDSLLRKATGLDRPISQTPIPVPPVPPVPGVKSLLSQPSGRAVGRDAAPVDAEQSAEDGARRSGRLSHGTWSISSGSESTTIHGHGGRAGSREVASPPPLPPTSASSASASASASPSALSFDPPTSHLPNAGSLAASAPQPTVAPLTSSSLVAKAFALFGEIGQLPAQEQPGVYQKIAELSEIARRPLNDRGLDAPFPPSAPAAEDWEVAPGRLTAQQPAAAAAASRPVPVGFSSSYLRREVVTRELAPQVSRSQRVLNKHLPPLGVVRMDRAGQGWECNLTVLEGFVRVRMEGLEARMSQGGILVVGPGSDCVVTNVMHQESKIQVRWTKEE